jgi:endonuclease YncB( thermonuclease family)
MARLTTSARSETIVDDMTHRQLIWSLLLLGAFAVRADAQNVTKVRGGDTLEVSGLGRVRLAGIVATDPAVALDKLRTTAPPRSGPDSPPPPLIGGRINLTPDRPARTFLTKLVLGRTVRLEYDPLTKDAPGVPRVYMYLPDGTLVNAEMLREGHARVDTSMPFSRVDEFSQIELDAKDAKRGVWAEVGSPP